MHLDRSAVINPIFSSSRPPDAALAGGSDCRSCAASQSPHWDPNLVLARQFQGIDAVIDFGGSNGTREMADLAAGCVKLWQIVAVGYDKFDLDYWREKKIPVSNCPGQLSAAALAECAMMLMLLLARHWTQAQISLTQRKLFVPVAEELEAQRLLVIGFGASGKELAHRAHCFRMRVSAIDVRPILASEKGGIRA